MEQGGLRQVLEEFRASAEGAGLFPAGFLSALWIIPHSWQEWMGCRV